MNLMIRIAVVVTLLTLFGCGQASVVPAWVANAEPACDIVNGVLTSLDGLAFVSSDGDRYMYRGTYTGEVIDASRTGEVCEQTFALVPCAREPGMGYCWDVTP